MPLKIRADNHIGNVCIGERIGKHTNKAYTFSVANGGNQKRCVSKHAFGLCCCQLLKSNRLPQTTKIFC